MDLLATFGSVSVAVLVVLAILVVGGLLLAGYACGTRKRGCSGLVSGLLVVALLLGGAALCWRMTRDAHTGGQVPWQPHIAEIPPESCADAVTFHGGQLRIDANASAPRAPRTLFSGGGVEVCTEGASVSVHVPGLPEPIVTSAEMPAPPRIAPSVTDVQMNIEIAMRERLQAYIDRLAEGREAANDELEALRESLEDLAPPERLLVVERVITRTRDSLRRELRTEMHDAAPEGPRAVRVEVSPRDVRRAALAVRGIVDPADRPATWSWGSVGAIFLLLAATALLLRLLTRRYAQPLAPPG